MNRKSSSNSSAANSKTVGVWIRVSTEDQAKGESPQHHEARARMYAESKGWQVAEVYHLEGVSGKDVMSHPETARMLADIKRGHITGLIFSKLARLARNTRHLLDLADVFEKYKADLVSLHESIDTSTPAGRLFYTLFAAMAQWEREEIAERVAASVPIRAKLGKPLGGVAPYGYRWVDKQLQPDETEAPIRKLMLELFVQHRRVKTVTRELNQRGYRSRNGKLWTPKVVTDLITRTDAKGVHLVNYTSHNGSSGKPELKPQEEWVHVAIPPIVPEELWERCNLIMGEMRNNRRPRGRRPVQPFAGLVKCQCGGMMYVPSNNPKYVCRRCRNKIPITDLESIYHEQLKGFFVGEVAATFEPAAQESIRQREAMLSQLEAERQKVRQQTDTVFELLMAGQLTKDSFAERHRPLEQRLAQLGTELPRLQAELDYLRISLVSGQQVLEDAKSLHDHWPTLDNTEKRQVIENITEAIVIGDSEVTINLSYLPSVQSSELVATGAPHPDA